MQREKTVTLISDAIQKTLDKQAEIGDETWECFLPPDASLAMARVAVAIIEAYEASEKFAEKEGCTVAAE